MDPVSNPYAPGAGTPPPELAGRSELIADATVSLRRTAIGRATQSPILVGLRGVGKTVLLVKIKDIADVEGFHSISHKAKHITHLEERFG
jgi:replication-associated recombination protein RarA